MRFSVKLFGKYGTKNINMNINQPLINLDPKEPLPKDLPNQVLLKTKTETFNHQYYIAVRYGKLKQSF